MSNIIIVQCMSTGINYVQDIIDRNHNPIILELKLQNDSDEARQYIEDVRSCYDLIDDDFELIYEKDSYEETLEMVKAYDPLLIVPGTEEGVILATRLSNDLNLLCNPIENIDAMTLKDEMHNRLAENGLRYIKGNVVKSVEEAIDYYEREGLKKVVVKPVYSAASVGVKICMNKQEMIKDIDELFSLKGVYGNDINGILIQEFIDGVEYVVNTVSCKGVHRVTTIWKYNKVNTSEGGHIYDYDETVDELNLGESELVEYAYDVCDALGIQYGPVHGEYMVDENGPVLIEVNCRPHGGNLEANFLDRISGQHETDSSLDSYLNPDKFNHERKKKYELFAMGVIKSFIVPKDMIAKSAPIENISTKLKSHYKTRITQITDAQPFLKTQDMETSCGDVYLVHEDPYQVYKDVNLLRDIERKAFQLVLSEEDDNEISVEQDEIYRDIESLCNQATNYGTGLLVTDNVFEDLNILQVSPENIKELNGKFDCVIVNLNKSLLDIQDFGTVSIFLEILDKVKVGGLIIVPKTTYEFMPNSRVGAEALIKSLDLKIELPLHHMPKMIIASKR